MFICSLFNVNQSFSLDATTYRNSKFLICFDRENMKKKPTLKCRIQMYYSKITPNCETDLPPFFYENHFLNNKNQGQNPPCIPILPSTTCKN